FTSDSSILLDTKTAGSYVAFYWGGAMVGRFIGAVTLDDKLSAERRTLLMALFPMLAMVVVYTAVQIQELDKSIALGFGAVLLLNYAAFRLSRKTPSALLLMTMSTGGKIALWAVLGVGLFNSIMWSNIFTLAIAGLKQYTSYGSSLLVMMIAGGALLPLLQGLAADAIGVKYGYIVPTLAYAYLVFYGWKGYQVKTPDTV
ncbi:MAG TPA: hypothetical protein PKD70_09620, partial [Saprospiraceae bacterium]|nr:hypothetical protein [Saprospiraceae bacterium]